MSKKIRGDSDLFILSPNYNAFLKSRGLYDPFSFILNLVYYILVNQIEWVCYFNTLKL